MRPLGYKKTKTKVEGHQNCGTCHPELKSGRAAEKAAWRRDDAELDCRHERSEPQDAE